MMLMDCRWVESTTALGRKFMPTAVQRQVPTTQKIQRSVEVRQVEFAREAVDVIVIVRRRLPTIQKVQKLVEVSKV